MASKFGAIPTPVICRMTELTKNEIIVLCYLYSCLHRQTKQCNPRQSEIATATEIHKSHVSRAIDGLLEKGWICKQLDKNFTFTIPMLKGKPTLPFTGEKVTKSATPKLPISQLPKNAKVTNFATKVADLVTKSCEIGNSLNKDKNIVHIKNILGGDVSDENLISESAKKSKRGTRLSEPFLLTKKMREWASDRCPGVDAVIETEKFCNHWRAKAGKDAVKLDWAATWRNWMLNARDRYGVRNNGTNRPNNTRATPGERIKNRWYRKP